MENTPTREAWNNLLGNLWGGPIKWMQLRKITGSPTDEQIDLINKVTNEIMKLESELQDTKEKLESCELFITEQRREKNHA